MIYENSDEIKNEINISDIIKNNIKNYDHFFYFHYSYSPLSITNINNFDSDDDMDYDEENKNADGLSKYILFLYSDNGNIININDYFTQISGKQFIYEIIEVYGKLKKIIKKIHDINIVYGDITFENILINTKTNNILIKNFKRSKINSNGNKEDFCKDYEKINYIFIKLITKINDNFKDFPLQIFLKSIMLNDHEYCDLYDETKESREDKEINNIIYGDFFIETLNKFIKLNEKQLNKKNKLVLF